jgi:hypothetical protein
MPQLYLVVFSSARAKLCSDAGLASETGMATRDKLILGARAPSPAMSAKRETDTASSLRLNVLRALWRARAPALPVLTGSFQIGSIFWGRLRSVTRLPHFLRDVLGQHFPLGGRRQSCFLRFEADSQSN